jgi:TonB family protein
MGSAVERAWQPKDAAGPGSERSAEEARAAMLRARAELLRPSDISRIIESVRSEYAIEARSTPEAELAFLRRAAESGKPDALLALGLYLAYATEGGGDPFVAIDLFRRAHEAGSTRALTELGRLHLSGLGLTLDPDKAVAYFEKARAGGDAEGAFLLGMAHRLDLFAGADPGLARLLLEESAARGHVGAQTTAYLLQKKGELDFGGTDVVVPWLEAAARTGDSIALYELGHYYMKAGRFDDGFAALSTAAEAGSPSAREMVVRLALRDRPTPAMVESAVRLAREMTAVPELADGDMLFLRAAVEALMAQSGKNDSDPLAWLRMAEARKEHRAAVARMRIERGEDPRTVFRETDRLSTEQAYVQMFELRLDVEAATPVSDVLPRPIAAPEVPYPAELRSTKQSGRVVVEFVVDPQGNVTKLSIVEASHPAFAAAALETLQHWRFTPGRKGGKSVHVKMRQPFNFRPE